MENSPTLDRIIAEVRADDYARCTLALREQDCIKRGRA
jgi:hypothetical protein